MQKKHKEKFELELQPVGMPATFFSTANSIDENASFSAPVEDAQDPMLQQLNQFAADGYTLNVSPESLLLFDLESQRLAYDCQNPPRRFFQDKDRPVSVMMLTTMYCAVLIISAIAAGAAALPVAAWLIGAALVAISIGLAVGLIRDSRNAKKAKTAEIRYREHRAMGPAAYQFSLRQAQPLPEYTEKTPLLSLNR